MLNINIDIKAIIILALGVALTLSLIFRPSVPIETYDAEIKALKEQNKRLSTSNDSLSVLNHKLQQEIDVILYTIDSTKVLLRVTEEKLKELEKRRDEIPDVVDNMSSDDVTNTISDYLKRRNSNNSQ